MINTTIVAIMNNSIYDDVWKLPWSCGYRIGWSRNDYVE